MKRMILLLTLISAFSTTALAQQSCLMNMAQQRQLILDEAENALLGQANECFERLVKSQMDQLKKSGSSIADDRNAVIQDLWASAMKGEIFESGAHE